MDNNNQFESKTFNRNHRILFIQTTVNNPATVPHWGYCFTEPGVCWVAGAINVPGWDYQIIDADQETDAKVCKTIKIFEPEVIGFSCYTPGYQRALRLSAYAKTINPKVVCLFGGWHPSLQPESVIKEVAVDTVAVGEGERLINVFLNAPEKFRSRIMKASSYPGFELSHPARIKKENFALFHFFGVPPLNEQRSATIAFSNGGCPFRCSYCCSHLIYGNGKIVRSLGIVISEICELINKYGVNFIFLRDPNPAVYKNYLESFCDEIIRLGLNKKVRFHSFGDVRLMTKQLLKKMADAGWSGLNYGIETFDRSQLRNLGRSTDLERMKNVIRWTQELGIFVTANIIIWKPGDSIESVKSIISGIKWLRPDEVLLLFFVPFPGTMDDKRYAHLPKRTNRFEDYHLQVPILELDSSITTEELLRLQREIPNSYYGSSEYADLIEFRKKQLGKSFWYLSKVRRERRLKYGLDIWKLKFKKRVRSAILIAENEYERPI